MTEQGRISREQAESMLRRAHSDRVWQESLREAYQGRHDVMDALWWSAHPLTRSPAGTDDPAQALRSLQRAVFSRPDVPNASPSDSERELRALQAILADDSAKLLEAVTKATKSIDPGVKAEISMPARARTARQASAHEASAHETSIVEVIVDDPTMPAPPRWGGRRVVAACVIVAGVIAALIFIPSVPGTENDSDAGYAEAAAPSDPIDGPDTNRQKTEIVSHTTGGYIGDPEEIFDRPETAADRIDGRLAPPGLESLRRLPDLAWEATMYLARSTEENDLCLLVIRSSTAFAGCTSTALFEREGLSLRGSTRYEIWPDATVLTESFILRPDGNFVHEITMRAPIQRPENRNQMIVSSL